MIVFEKNKDIALSQADAIVNASNGIGYMGGQKGIESRKKGVAESLHYISKGAIEPLAKSECKKHSRFGYASGNIFITPAPNLHCKYIIHAVTMRLPGSKSKIKIIPKLLQAIIRYSEENHFDSVAIPLLGTGTGRLRYDDVIAVYKNHLTNSKIKFYVYLPSSYVSLL